MTITEEREMDALARQLSDLTSNPPWEAMRYGAIADTLKKLTEYCVVCDCYTSATVDEMRLLTVMLQAEKEAHARTKEAYAQASANQGRAGGNARAAKLTPERRREIASAAGRARWMRRG